MKKTDISFSELFVITQGNKHDKLFTKHSYVKLLTDADNLSFVRCKSVMEDGTFRSNRTKEIHISNLATLEQFKTLPKPKKRKK